MSENKNQKSVPTRHAGPYGFSRRELTALLVILLLIGAGTITRWWQRASTPAVPAWIVENVVLATQRDNEDAANQVPERKPTRDVPHATTTEIDLNSASARELKRLPGIGPALAERIILDREQHGLFRNLTDLKRVRGIGDKIAANMADWVRFDIPVHSDTADKR